MKQRSYIPDIAIICIVLSIGLVWLVLWLKSENVRCSILR